jgi:small subunit ribosomal protein S2
MAGTAASIDLKRLFDTGAHFAQVKSRRHPTTDQLEAAKNAMATLAKEGKTVLFVGGKVEIVALVRKAAQDINTPFVASRWLGGTISNWAQIKKRIDRFAELTQMSASGALAKQHTKLELVKLDREKKKLFERFEGITGLTKRPDALLVVDTKHEKHAVKEARDAGIPIIAIMSSDCDLRDAAYPIVANDASRETVKLLLVELTQAFQKGQVA